MFYGLIKFEVILRHANDTDLYITNFRMKY